jgi:hypothetical protein
MKILCLLVLLANILLLMWEYRSGAFTAHKENTEQHVIYGKEQIFLVHELKKEPHPLLPKINQETQMDVNKADNPFKEMQDNIEHTNTTTAKQSEYPQIPLP